MSLNPAQLAYSSKFYDLPPTGVSGDSAKSWISRGAGPEAASKPAEQV